MFYGLQETRDGEFMNLETDWVEIQQELSISSALFPAHVGISSKLPGNEVLVTVLYSVQCIDHTY